MNRADIAHRTKVLRRAATRPRGPYIDFLGVVHGDRVENIPLVTERPVSRMTWKAARALVLEIHRPDRKSGARAPSRRPRPCQGGKLRPAPGQWWQARFADLVERRRAALDVETYRLTPTQKRTLVMSEPG